MTLGIIASLIGAMLLAAGIYYLVKEKNDHESKKIYMTSIVAGAIVLAFGIIKLISALG